MLKEWIAVQPHLRARTDDQWLAAFLRGCNHSVEHAKEKIDLYYTLGTIAPEIHPLKASDPKIKEILKLGFILVLPKTVNPGDPRIIIVRTGIEQPDKYTPGEILSVGHLIQKILYMEDDNFIVAGGVTIMDFQSATGDHFAQMTPVMLKKMVVAGQDAAPVRMKDVHYINFPHRLYSTSIFNIGKSLLNEKDRNSRIHIHRSNYSKNPDSLHNFTTKYILPVEYGGNGGTVQEIIDYWVKKIDEYSAFFKEEEQFGTDKKLRPGKARSAQDMFSAEGLTHHNIFSYE